MSICAYNACFGLKTLISSLHCCLRFSFLRKGNSLYLYKRKPLRYKYLHVQVKSQENNFTKMKADVLAACRIHTAKQTMQIVLESSCGVRSILYVHIIIYSSWGNNGLLLLNRQCLQRFTLRLFYCTLVPEALCEAKETRGEKERASGHIGCKSHFLFLIQA